MPDYTGGYTSAIDSAKRREYEDSQIALTKDIIDRRKKYDDEYFRDQQQAKAQQAADDAAYMVGLQSLSAPPPTPAVQPPMPGTPSQPMLPPTGMPPSPMAMSAMAPQAQMGMGAAPQMRAPPPGMAPPPAPTAAPGGAPAPGAAMPQRPPFAPGMAPIPGGQFSGGPAGGGVPPGSTPSPGATPVGPPPSPQGGDWVSGAISAMVKQGIKDPGTQRWAIERMMPLVESQGKARLEKLKEDEAVQKATTAAEDATRRRILAEKSGRRISETEQIAQDLENPTLSPETRKILEARVNYLTSKGKGGTGGGGGGAAATPGATKKGSPEDIALDTQAWNYIKKGVLPYRKGTGGGKDKNDQVMKRVGQIAVDLGMNSEDLINQSAEYKADAQSLAFQTKKLDAIEGTLSSFHNNVQTWNSVAKGEAPKLNPEGFKALGSEFGKMDFTDVKSVNDIMLRIKQEFNDPTTAAYLTAAMTVAMDYARIMQGPQSVASLTEGARKDAERLIASGYNDKARAAVIASLESDTQGQVKGVRDQRDRIEGRMKHKKLGEQPSDDTDALRKKYGLDAK